MGFAHVEFANLADATKAFEAHAAEPLVISGRTVHINYAAGPTVVGTLPFTIWDEEPRIKAYKKLISDIRRALEQQPVLEKHRGQ